MKQYYHLPNSITYNNMEWYCVDVMDAMKGMTYDQKRITVAPLSDYIFSGRATCDFCRALINTKPYLIARRLLQGGSDQEIMKRIKKYLHEGDEENA